MPTTTTGFFLLFILRLQSRIKNAMKQRTSLSGPLCTESSFTDEANLQVGRYSAEERKERILKYRAKRTQRNFTKTIKVLALENE